MSRRVNQLDTPADRALRDCLLGPARQSFVMVAGAGSGKTTSLIKALSAIIDQNRATLKRQRQRVACITYTDIAAGEIWADVGNNPLIHVSTIHSFLWLVIKPFQRDINAWVGGRIDDRLVGLREEAAAWGPRVRDATKEKNRRDIARYQQDRERIASVDAFTYGTGSDYQNGVLGHDDVLKLGSSFLNDRPLFRRLLAQQFPFLFVDESQDTTHEIVAALKRVEAELRPRICLGFFGDPMQRIYPTGIGKIAVETGWAEIDKPENFRCSQAVLKVANKIRRGGDALVQTGGRKEPTGEGEDTFVQGTARIFVLPADDKRDESLALVRDWVAQQNTDPSWASTPASAVKVLVIVHRMAAKRLGFAELYGAMNDGAPETFKSGFLDGSAWPVRPFLNFALPLAQAMAMGQEFEAMQLLRQYCPRLGTDALKGQDVAALLVELRQAAQRLVELMEAGTVADVLSHLSSQKLVALDPRILAYLHLEPIADEELGEEEVGDASKEATAMAAFLACPATQFASYRTYVDEQSPFSTQQGVKGAEFPQVLVVLDDDEGTHNQFSYDKYFGVKEPSKADLKNIEEGKETAVERTRRLFYVCCTRALTDLVVVYFCNDPSLAEQRVREAQIFPDDMVYSATDLPK